MTNELIDGLGHDNTLRFQPSRAVSFPLPLLKHVYSFIIINTLEQPSSSLNPLFFC